MGDDARVTGLEGLQPHGVSLAPRRGDVGRVGFGVRRPPQVLPPSTTRSWTTRRGPTTHDSILTRIAGQPVAFEVDGFDAVTEVVGASVCTATAREITGEADSVKARLRPSCPRLMGTWPS